jgi:hypothetical protein
MAVHCESAENVHQHLRVLFRLFNSGYNWSSATTGYVCKKVKESRNRPGVAQRVTGGLGSQTFMTFST